MIAKLGRLAAAGVLATLVGAGALVSAPSSSALTDSAVDRFGSCLNAQKSGQVLIMIDESGSLTDTDPSADRVKAAGFFVKRLEQFAVDSGSAIEVGVSGFASDFSPPANWTRLDQNSLTGVESEIDSFRNRNSGSDTDYWTALNGAREALTAHRAQNTEAPPCQALAWFSDGKIDYSLHPGVEKPYAPGVDLGTEEGKQATIHAAQESICRPAGVADQLRSSGIITFGIGLSPEGKNEADFDVMKSIVTGEQTPTGACGDIVKPRPGEFYLAKDIDDLLLAFDTLSTPNPPITTETGTCPGNTICDEAKHSFVLDRSVRSVSALATADRTGLVSVLIPPTGEPQELKAGAPGTIDFGGVSVAYEWLSDKSVSFRMTNPTAPSWQGQWALIFQDPSGNSGARTKSSLHISGDLYPAWGQQRETTLHSGETVPVTFSVVDDQQKPVDPTTLLGEAALTATLVDAAGKEHPVANAVPKDQITAPQQLDLKDVPVGRATLRLTLEVTTAPAFGANGAPVPGTTLSPQSVDLPVVINAPVGYPAVSSRIDFGTLEGVGTRTATLEVKGPGCAWVPADAPVKVVAGPDGVSTPEITSSSSEQSNCLKVDDGQTRSLPLTAELKEQGNGVVNGTVQVTVAPKDAEGPPVTVDVPFTLAMEKELDTTKFGFATILGLVLGPGIPIGLLYLTKWFASRIPGKALRAERIPVRVTGGSVLRDNQPFALRDGELVRLVEGLAGPTRKFDIGDIELRVHLGLSPFGAGYVVASAPGMAGAGGQSGATHGKTPDAKLPLAVQNTWFVLHDPHGAEDAATVVLLVGSDADRSVIDRLVGEVREALPRVLPELRQRAQLTAPPAAGSQPPPGSGPFGSGGPFGPGTPGGPPSDNPFATGAPAGAPPPNNPFPAGPPPPANPFGGPAPGGPGQGQPPAGPPNPNPFGAVPQPGSDPPNPFRPN